MGGNNEACGKSDGVVVVSNTHDDQIPRMVAMSNSGEMLPPNTVLLPVKRLVGHT